MRGARAISPRAAAAVRAVALVVALVASLVVSLAFVALPGCNDDPPANAPTDAGATPGGLTREQAAQVLAKVGDRTITLGDYAATLERMNAFERIRYQSKERRQDLLKQMIDLELLAQEAKRRGLDKRPEVQEAIRQILREAMLAKAREGVPPPAEIPADEIRAYYEANKEKFREPERRRISAIVLGDPDKAKEVLGQLGEAAKGPKAAQRWGELFFEHSLTAPKEKKPNEPIDLAGDLGIVGPPGDDEGSSAKVPEAVRRVVFGLKAVGDIHDAAVEADGKFFIVRMSGQSQGHTRTLAEADRTIRVAILQQRVREREQQLEQELRKKYAVTIDEAALSSVELPAALKDYKPLWDEGEQPQDWSLAPSAAPRKGGPNEAPDDE